ncbi:hypothetical protein SAMN05443287_101421 [Micromonospora phaseoli]|uniref:Uncharacterized protein n=1 Tax=Micromonospora phaseoli TaxID=1144548 RepID=A0A1H6RV68_9ACTN|nr:hypothetical protein [Micromonospora phaseoli]PZW03676.1 hypothetical protein CLV64_101421 [Micromonospora phaseoli]GIJ80340.1 hypothetical protein Xph01_47720 [Micromonospora phaseoli]SEI59641.1 hypothetical protein SAMN05443287_101421 [Micromonospora phaseoli]
MLRIAVLATALLVTLAGCANDQHSPSAPGLASTGPSGAEAPITAPPAPGSDSARSSPVPTSGEAQILAGVGFRTLVASAPHDFLAMMRGRLAVGRGGCLALQAEEGPDYLVVWPPGVTLLPDGRAGVHLPEAGSVTVGEQISGAGGFSEIPLTGGAPPGLFPPVPPECADGSTVVAVITSVGRSRVG